MDATTITLREINRENWRSAIKLELDETQKSFVAPNWYSIIEAIFSNGEFQSRAIYSDDEMIGYAMTGVDPVENQHWIVRFMIAKPHQRKGYGRAAMRVIIEELKRLHNPDAIYISFEPENIPARTLYESFGFQDTGKIEDGEMVFKLTLND